MTLLAVDGAIDYGQLADMFESVMLICFGASWPISIIKTLRVRRVTGKSLIFLCMVFIGYLAGICAKFAIAANLSKPVSSVVILYAMNATLVAVDICLYLKFSGKDAELPRSSS